MTNRGSRIARAASGLVVVLVLLAGPGLAGAGHRPLPPESDFPPTTAVPQLTIQVGDRMTVGGPMSDNFLPDTWMNVYVVPHRTWRDGDALGANAVQKARVRSNAKGQLPLTQVWKSDAAGQFDIIVDYDRDGRFSYALDAIDAVIVRAK